MSRGCRSRGVGSVSAVVLGTAPRRGGTTTVEFGPDATQVDVLAAAAGHVDEEGRIA